ncbi:MAG: hypothetical protein MNPFHGCM_00003 [Gemmatimonadaceae bacterium]|nr:hypothetical protein [Gemmatimonadaceae bacterium]
MIVRRSIVAAALIVAVSARSGAQTPTAPPSPAPTRPGKVMLTGENPGIRLLDKPGGTTVTQISFWRIHWSPVGPGHVCYVTTGDEKTPGALRIAIFDNQKLFDYLTRDVLGTYNKSYVERPFTPVSGATVTTAGDGTAERRETCKSDKYTVELVWQDLGTPSLVDFMPGTRPPNPFGLTFVQIPAGRSQVLVNGKPAPGVSIPGGGFLALGETWMK